MATSKVLYTSNLRTEATHLASGNTIITDAPVDNHGKGEAFSPTDLLATALASCMLTIIGIAAEAHNFSIDGTTAEVTKIMASNPRRVAEVKIIFQLPTSVEYTEKQKRLIKAAINGCPVLHSLHPDLIKDVVINY